MPVKPDPERQERERLYRIWLNEIDASMNENLAPWLKAFTTVLERENGIQEGDVNRDVLERKQQH